MVINDVFRQQLDASRIEEEKDIVKYQNLVNIANQHGYCKIAGILNDIICDEKSHVKILKEILGG